MIQRPCTAYDTAKTRAHCASDQCGAVKISGIFQNKTERFHLWDLKLRHSSATIKTGTFPFGKCRSLSSMAHQSLVVLTKEMSFSLEDIIAAALQQQQQPVRSQRQVPQPRQSYGLYPFDFVGEDEEDEDDSYYQGYPSYYPQFFNPYSGYAPSRRQYRRQAPAPQSQAQPTQAPQSQSVNQYDGQTLSLPELFQFLAQQGLPTSAGTTESDETKEAETSEESSREPEKEKEAEEVAEPTSNTAVEDAVPKPTPSLARRHSVAKFQDPLPKIEISTKNYKNPSIPYSPQTNVYESTKDYNIVLAIPGASLKTLDIDFHPSSNELVIKGSIPQISSVISDSSSISKIDEIRSGSIERRIKFPNLPKIKDEEIKAKYINGLLTIRVPKNLEDEPKVKRKVTIEDVPDEELLWEEKGGLV